MTKEEQLGGPPIEVMRRLLDENRALLRLLSFHTVNDAEPGSCTETDSANVVSAYREMIQLLEILSATSAAATGEEVSGQ